MGLLNNYDGQVWRVNEMVQMLENQDARHNLVREVVEYAVESHEAGIVVDFESIPDKSQPNFREFVSELGSALHSVGLKLMVEAARSRRCLRLQVFRQRSAMRSCC